MAAVSNARSAKSVKVYAADYTSTQGDADLSITLSGGVVYLVSVLNGDSDVTKEGIHPSWSISSGTITVVIPSLMDVTTGSVYIVYA